MAAGSTAGIGGRGRNSTATKFVWFSESWDMTEIRKFAPQLTKEAQAYIICFETLAQLALAKRGLARLQSKHFKFVLPSASDNTSAEASISKSFTTTKPLASFVKLVASLSARNHVQRRTPGQTNSAAASPTVSHTELRVGIA